MHAKLCITFCIFLFCAGGEFRAQVSELLKEREIKQVFGLPHSPFGQGTVERLNATLKQMLFSETDGDASVGTFGPALKRIVKAYNAGSSVATGFAPDLLNDPHLDPRVRMAVLEKLNTNAKGQNPNARYQPPLKYGDSVRIAVEALDNDVKRQIKNGTYKPSHFATFSDEVFQVKSQDKNGFISLLTDQPLLAKDRFQRGDVLLIQKPADKDE